MLQTQARADFKDEVQAAVHALLTYCRESNWSGYDPFDALNSRLFQALPFVDSRLPRLVFTQTLKRSPVNLRRLLFVPQTQNSKAIALFLSAFLKLIEFQEASQSDAEGMIERLKLLRSPSTSYWCWGYSFPWQTRTVIVPAGAPNVVCTTFVANALLEAYEHFRQSECLAMAVSAAEYIVDNLYWEAGHDLAGFSYPLPGMREHVPNANFLAAALLSRVFGYTQDSKFMQAAIRAARCSAAAQSPAGSWIYADSPKGKWIDNFHTGYNLCALRTISRSLNTTEFDISIQRGLRFYLDHFFRADGAPKYFHNRTYPIDIHCVAQSIITLTEFSDLDPGAMSQAVLVFRWAMKNMWSDRGRFYYRVLRLCTIRTSYMRWSQAWMVLALATMMEHSVREGPQHAQARSAVLL